MNTIQFNKIMHATDSPMRRKVMQPPSVGLLEKLEKIQFPCVSREHEVGITGFISLEGKTLEDHSRILGTYP